MSNLPGCSIVIVSYRSGEFLYSCLDSIFRATKNLESEVIVHDNGDDTEAIDKVKKQFPSVLWTGDAKNIGFGAACNTAAKTAKYPYLFFVNPDTLVSSDTFEKMLSYHIEHPDLGVVGCKILNGDGSLQWACRRSFPSLQAAVFKTLGLANLMPKSKTFGAYNLTYLDEDEETEVDAVSGSFFCIRKELFEQVKGFDEDFFLYGEDLDICYRTQKAGFPNQYFPKTSVVHFKGQSSRKRPLLSFFHFYQAMMIFARKHREFRPVPLFLVALGILFSSFAGALQRLAPRWKMWLSDIFLAIFSIIGTKALLFPQESVSMLPVSISAITLFLYLLLWGEYRDVVPGMKVDFLRGVVPAGILAGGAGWLLSGQDLFLVSTLSIILLLSIWKKLMVLGKYFFNMASGLAFRSIVLGTNSHTASLLAEEELRSVLPGRDLLGSVKLKGDSPEYSDRHCIGKISQLDMIRKNTGVGEVLAVASLGGFAELTGLEEFGLRRSLLVGSIDAGSFVVVDLDFIH